MNAIQEIESGNFSVPRWNLFSPDSVRVVSWNIDRGSKLRRVIEFLAGEKADIVLLQEADLYARRTHHINVAREIAQKLAMNYVFGREFQELKQGTKPPRPTTAKQHFRAGLYQIAASSNSRGNHISGPALVSSRNPALSGEAWRAPGTGQRRQYCGQNSRYLQRASGE